MADDAYTPYHGWMHYGPRIDKLKPSFSYQEIGERLGGLTKDQVRRYWRDWKRNRTNPPTSGAPLPTIDGHGVSDEMYIDEDRVWREALRLTRRQQDRQERKASNALRFPSGPIGLVFLADLHLGSPGVDYQRLDDDITAILDTPGLYVVAVGDMLDNFIIGRLKDIRISGAPFAVCEEWALARRVLRRLAPRLVGSVSGNHDLWTYAVSGIDYLAEIHAALTPGILYDKFNLMFDLHVADTVVPFRVRHAWTGSSIYNPTHGIERAAKFDKGEVFTVGVGAHTHRSGVAREFNNGGETGIAILCGSYKVSDNFADMLGLPKANESAAVTVLVDEFGNIDATNNLAWASRILKSLYPGQLVHDG